MLAADGVGLRSLLMKTKHLCWLVFVAVVGLAASLAPNDPKLTTREVMRSKLDSSQKVLEGIATENFALITANAQRLVVLSQVAGWQARQTPEYRQLTAEFRRHAEALVKSAKDGNAEAASLAWLQLTISCVNCHKHIRGARTVGIYTPSPLLTAAIQ